jgi:hypothetical protein
MLESFAVASAAAPVFTPLATPPAVFDDNDDDDEFMGGTVGFVLLMNLLEKTARCRRRLERCR